MKTFAKFAVLFCSVLATLSLAAGLNQVAAKLDPISQKARVLSTFDQSTLPDPPCAACIIDPE